MKRFCALLAVLLAGPCLPASADDEGMIRMMLLTQIYQGIAETCEAIDVDPAYARALNETATLLRAYTSEQTWANVEAAAAAEAVDCDPQSNWVVMFLRAQDNFTDSGGQSSLTPPD